MEELKKITTKELEEKIDKGENLNMIDVREDEEVAEGMIPGAVHIKMGEIPERLDELEKDKEYIIICRSGGRSGRVCHFLQDQGYKVTNMEGGMLNWHGEKEF
ncbi:rhodanese-like domain-containing protein [Peribacillus kribbensis]|uniref:rhodanese-like domain-containing protein n=1 Tax=Peribacillus kribbensis TaxID=356658 RepID=UPI000410BDD9|nr:rhodanese-like domain-containing protein [Peribacillus kribbensis]